MESALGSPLLRMKVVGTLAPFGDVYLIVAVEPALGFSGVKLLISGCAAKAAANRAAPAKSA